MDNLATYTTNNSQLSSLLVDSESLGTLTPVEKRKVFFGDLETRLVDKFNNLVGTFDIKNNVSDFCSRKQLVKSNLLNLTEFLENCIPILRRLLKVLKIMLEAELSI